MIKNISFLALAGAMTFMTSACIVVTDDTADDETSTGDGDGDPTGDGDGDPTGDGDGDPTTGDGDGDPAPACGWDGAASVPGYYCGGEGEDPDGQAPIACPDGLVEGDSCATTGLTGAGCCDAEGNNWYCAGEDAPMVFFESCAG